MAFAGTSRFDVVRLLGTGGMGHVYLVQDRQLEARVALKTLNQAAGIDLFRFKREFRALADIRHANLVALHELFSEGELWFFTMEYVDGVPFNRFVPTAASGPADAALLRKTTLQLAEGVYAMHVAGAIHRDLKPSNVLVTSAGRVVVLDFGLAKQSSSNSLSGDGIVGTPTHMAPEQAMEQPCTPAADWYAVGSMIYEALAGRPPFLGSLFTILIKKQSEDPIDPRTFNPRADPGMSDLCMALMSRDPEQRPRGPEIIARLGGRRDKVSLRRTHRYPAIGTPAPVLCGRSAELDLLARAYAKIGTGSQAVIWVQGASGIGKTCLVESFLQSLGEAETSVPPLILRGRCHEREALPFKAFDSVVDDLSQHLDKLSASVQSIIFPDHVSRLADIFPVLRRIEAIEQGCYPSAAAPDAGESRNQAFTAFRELLKRLARLGPVVIFIDDLQWADRDSFALLRTIMQQPGAPALLVVLASRSSLDPRTSGTLPALRDLAQLPGVDIVPIGPLPDDDVQALADYHVGEAAIAPELRRQVLTSVVGEASGNPFFAVELVQHFLDMMLPEDASAAPTGNSDYRLDGMILKRVGGLPEPARRMLEIIAAARDPVAQRTLASAVGVSFGSDVWERNLQTLVDGRLVGRRGRQGEDAVVIYHDRIAEAVLRHLDETTLRELHEKLALAVEQWDRDRKDKLARYWLSADDHARAKRYAIDAAAEARGKLAFNRAAELYETAITLEADGQERAALLRALGDCRASDGHAISAAEAYQKAAAGCDATQSVHLQHLAAEQLLRGGHIAEGLEILQGVLKQAGLRMAKGPRRALLSVVWRLVRLRLRGTDFVERPASSIPARKRRLLDVLWSANTGLGVVDILLADDFLLRFLFLAFEVGDLRRVAQGLAVLGGQLAALGSSRMPFARKLIGRAEVLAHRSGDPAVMGLARMSKAVIHYFAGEWETALGELTAVEEHFLRHCHGVSWELATTRSFICFTLRAQGRLRELCDRFDRYTADADRTGDRYLAANLRTYMAVVWQVRDDIPRARRDAEGLLDCWPDDKYQVQHFFHLYGRCEQALYEDQPELAARAMSADEPRIRGSAMLKIRGVRGEYAWLTGRLALAMAERKPPAERGPLLRTAMRGARYLLKLDQQTAISMGALLAAGVRLLSPQSDRKQVALEIERVLENVDAAGARSLAVAGRYWLADIVGGERGAELRAAAERWMTEQGVLNPERLAYTILPGFRASPTG
jgi:serine/threonine protein kinase